MVCILMSEDRWVASDCCLHCGRDLGLTGVPMLLGAAGDTGWVHGACMEFVALGLVARARERLGKVLDGS